MKKLVLAALFLLLCSQANAQQIVLPCVKTSGGCAPVTSSNPLPVTAAAGSFINLGTSVTAANPRISGDATTGFYTAGAAKVDVTISGVKTFEWGSAGASQSNGLQLGLGTSTASSGAAVQAVLLGTSTHDAGIQFTYNNTGFGGGAITSNGGSGFRFFGFTGAVGSESYTQNAALSGSGFNIITGSLQLNGLNAINYPSNDSTVGNSIAIGPSALSGQSGASAAYKNIAIGAFALGNGNTMTTAAVRNTAVGWESLGALTTATQNTALGYTAGLAITTGGLNTALGYKTLQAETTGAQNTAIGNQALAVQNNGSNNTAVGAFAGVLQSSGAQNVYLGANTALSATTAFSNVIIGYGVAPTNLTANGGIILIGTDNTTDVFSPSTSAGVIGIGTGVKVGSGDTAVGFQVLNGTASDSNANTGFGYQALKATTTGTVNAAVGYQALTLNTTGQFNVAMGYQALASSTTGNSNTAVGYQALNLTTIGNNVAVGTVAMVSNSTGQDNVAIGSGAMNANTTAQDNTGIGRSSLRNNQTGSDNTAVGWQALKGVAANSFAGNTAVGSTALVAVTTGANNVAMGYQAGQLATTASNNLILGYQVASTVLTTGTGNILIGADGNTTTAASGTSNTLKIQGAGTTATITATAINGANPLVAIPGVTTGTNADFACFAAGGVFTLQTTACTISSRRFKENIIPVSETALDEFMELRPVQFNKKPMKVLDEKTQKMVDWKNPDRNFGETELGFIAEDIAELDPRLAVYEPDMKTPKSFRADGVQSLTVKAVQIIQKEVEQLQADKGHVVPVHDTFWKRMKWLFTGDRT